MIAKALFPILLLAATLIAALQSASAYQIIGQPSVFWRDGEWQVYTNGHWIPYAESKPQQTQATQDEQVNAPVPQPEIPLTDMNPNYYDGSYGYGYGGYGYAYGYPLWGYGFNGTHRHITHHRPFHNQTPFNLNNVSIGNIGRTTIGIGQPTIGIGQPNFGIGPQAGTFSHQFR